MTVEEMLREARSEIERVAPEEVSGSIEQGAIVVGGMTSWLKLGRPVATPDQQ